MSILSPVWEYFHRHVGRLAIPLLMAGALTASVITFASGPANTLEVYAQYEGPGIGNFEHPVPGTTVTVTPPCDQASVLTDEAGLAFFTGCPLDSPELAVTVTAYPDGFRPMECPAVEPLCSPSHTAAQLAEHPGSDIFVFTRPSPPTDYGYTYPDDPAPVTVNTAPAKPAGVPTPAPQAPTVAPVVSAVPSPSPVQTASSPTPAPKSVVAGNQDARTVAGIIAMTLLLILATIFIGRAIHRHLGR